MNARILDEEYVSLILKNKKLFILDMDGTFYLGDKLLDGSLKFIEKIRQTGKEFMFFTNNASKTPEEYMEKLKKMGCEVERKNIVTSGDVTIEYLLKNYSNSKIYLVGTPSLEESFRRSGINLADKDDKSADIVVVSFDLTLTYEKVKKACYYIKNGSLFLATHMDLNCPTEYGSVPDCGAICAMITASTGVEPKYLGKPFKETTEMIKNISGCDSDEMVVIGDRLCTDIAMGYKNGITSVLVLTGETRPEDIESSGIKPDIVLPSLGCLAELL